MKFPNNKKRIIRKVIIMKCKAQWDDHYHTHYIINKNLKKYTRKQTITYKRKRINKSLISQCTHMSTDTYIYMSTHIIIHKKISQNFP